MSILKKIKLDKNSFEDEDFGISEYRKQKIAEAERLMREAIIKSKGSHSAASQASQAAGALYQSGISLKPEQDLISPEDLMKIIMKQQKQMVA